MELHVMLLSMRGVTGGGFLMKLGRLIDEGLDEHLLILAKGC